MRAVGVSSRYEKLRSRLREQPTLSHGRRCLLDGCLVCPRGRHTELRARKILNPRRSPEPRKALERRLACDERLRDVIAKTRGQGIGIPDLYHPFIRGQRIRTLAPHHSDLRVRMNCLLQNLTKTQPLSTSARSVLSS
jgi:hypothetical protein